MACGAGLPSPSSGPGDADPPATRSHPSTSGRPHPDRGRACRDPMEPRAVCPAPRGEGVSRHPDGTAPGLPPADRPGRATAHAVAHRLILIAGCPRHLGPGDPPVAGSTSAVHRYRTRSAAWWDRGTPVDGRPARRPGSPTRPTVPFPSTVRQRGAPQPPDLRRRTGRMAQHLCDHGATHREGPSCATPCSSTTNN
jgi:hypothetical protein